MFLEEIKNKKEFRGLSDAFVSRVLLLCSTNYDVTKEKEKKMLVKEARAKLRELYSAYQLPGYSRKENYLKNMEHWGDKAVARRILSLHMSTKERVPYYDPLYAKLRKNVPFKTVLDLGCGLNVFSLPWMGYVAYYGIDVNKDDVDFCNTYLQKFGLQGLKKRANLWSAFLQRMLNKSQQKIRMQLPTFFVYILKTFLTALPSKPRVLVLGLSGGETGCANAHGICERRKFLCCSSVCNSSIVRL